MVPRHYHNPPLPAPARVRCPVCHHAVYSRATMHPQCAVHLSERPESKAKPPAVPGHDAQAATGPEPAGVMAAIDPKG
jgi:hypothetical protein